MLVSCKLATKSQRGDAVMDTDALRLTFNSAAAEAMSEAGAEAGPVQDFCEVWPSARPILDTISTVIALLPIPGIGVTAGAVLKGLLSIGDQVHKNSCK